MTFSIVTDAAEVLAGLIGEEDVGAEIDALAPTLEAAAGARERRKVDRIVDSDQHVRVFRGGVLGRERADIGVRDRFKSSGAHPRAASPRLTNYRSQRVSQLPSSASGSGTKIGHGLPDARSGWRGSPSGAPFSSRTRSTSRSTRAAES